MNINAEEFKPKEKGKSDFYSWNLYRWLKKQSKEPDWAKKTRIYRDNSDNELFIGARYHHDHHDAVTGVRLRHLASGSGYGKLPCSGVWVGSLEWDDVTEWFYAEYRKKGVCAIHGDFAHSFTENDDTRTCDYCGKVQHKTIKIIEKVVWK